MEQKNRKCDPITRIIFIKVHKAGSSTVATILQRFGIMRNLSFVLPNKELHIQRYNYIESLNRDDILPPPSSKKDNSSYDILCNHIIYNKTSFDGIFTSDVFKLAILRHPLEQFVSAFRYYGYTKKGYFEKIFNATDDRHVSNYLESPEGFEPESPYRSFTHNTQSLDMGLLPSDFSDMQQTKNHVSMLENDFDLIMILEYFEESLILLKRKLCWSFKDILYMQKNKRWNDKNLKLSVLDFKRLHNWNSADYTLYDRMYSKFWEEIHIQRNSFHEEVLLFKSILRDVRTHCFDKYAHSPLVIGPSTWNDGFTVDAYDCLLLKMNETELLDKIYHDLYGIKKSVKV